MGWCFIDENDRYTSKMLSYLEADMTAVVPLLWTIEVCNVLVVSERKRRINPADSSKFLSLLSSLPISLDTSVPNQYEICNLARRHHLSGYDASYLELAMRTGYSLATADTPLRKAAQQVGVTLLQ